MIAALAIVAGVVGLLVLFGGQGKPAAEARCAGVAERLEGRYPLGTVCVWTLGETSRGYLCSTHCETLADIEEAGR